MAKTVILYVRVSTPGQAEHGYSLRQQTEALEDYATSKGYEILETIPDEGHSGTTLDRPGLDKVRDLVEAGGVDVVLAQDADRITREPGHRAFLDDEFERYGTVLRALDDWGDDSHEGQLLKYVKGWSAKGERLKMAERTRRGRLRKTREGKIIANSCADYGFKYNETRDGYEVDPETIQVVRDVFCMVAEGESLYGVVLALDDVDPPGANNRSGQWGSTYIRRHIIEDDVYKPHAYEEIAALVSPDVAVRLDPNKQYGIWWANRYEVKTVRESTPGGNGAKQYKRRHDRRERPCEEWIAVPVPDAGIPLEHIVAAREAVQNNHRYPSKAAGRGWDLSGGIVRCGECGRGLTARHVDSRGRRYFYYYCLDGAGRGKCSNKKNVPAEKVEGQVADLVSDLLSDEGRLTTEIDALIEKERQSLRDPEPDAQKWANTLAEIAEQRDRYNRRYSKGKLSEAELDRYLEELDDQKAVAEKELSAIDGRRERIRELERDKAALQRAYHDQALKDGLVGFTNEQRREVYRRLKLVVYVHADQSIGITGDIPLAIGYLNKPYALTHIETDESGFGAFLVCQDQEWASVHSQSNSQDSSRFNDTS